MERTAHQELVRLISLLDLYEHAIAELDNIGDPKLDDLAGRLARLHERVALDLYSEYDISDIQAVRDGISPQGN